MASTLVPRVISRVISAHQAREGGGFVIRRSIGSGDLRNLDPFLMLDHMGPVNYKPGEAVGAPDHPHRGFETVTYVLDGGFHHQDSVGNEGFLTAGWVQWMTAGRGVIHSEMPTDELLEKGGRNEGFQLWVNLPTKDKMTAPRYQDTAPEKIPKVKTPDGLGEVVVIAGETLGTKAYIETRSPITHLDVRLQKGGSFTHTIASSHNAFFYVYRGAGEFGGENKKAKEGQYFVLEKGSGNTFTMKATGEEGCCGMLLTGEPIGEPIVQYGPFVMNTQAEIMQAFKDYQMGVLAAPIKGSEERYAKTEAAVRAQKESGRWNGDL